MPVLDLQDAVALFEQGKPSEAIPLLEQLIELMPTYVTAHALLARAYEAERQWDSALAVWHDAQYLMPNSPVVNEGIQRVLSRRSTGSRRTFWNAPPVWPKEPSAEDGVEPAVPTDDAVEPEAPPEDAYVPEDPVEDAYHPEPPTEDAYVPEDPPAVQEDQTPAAEEEPEGTDVEAEEDENAYVSIDAQVREVLATFTEPLPEPEEAGEAQEAPLSYMEEEAEPGIPDTGIEARDESLPDAPTHEKAPSQVLPKIRPIGLGRATRPSPPPPPEEAAEAQQAEAPDEDAVSPEVAPTWTAIGEQDLSDLPMDPEAEDEDESDVATEPPNRPVPAWNWAPDHAFEEAEEPADESEDEDEDVVALEDLLPDDAFHVEDALVEDELIEDELTEEALIEDEPFEDEPLEDELTEEALVEEALIEDESFEDEPLEDEPIEPLSFEDVPTEDELVEEALIEDEPTEELPDVETRGEESADEDEPEVEEEDAPPASEPLAPPSADDLDRLIDELESARIVPRPDLDQIQPPEMDDDIEDMVSETLARIYASQGQFDEAARIYELLAAQQPGRATHFLHKATEMRARAGEG